MEKVREQNRQRQARYLSKPTNKKKASLRQKERYNHVKAMKNPKTEEMNNSALISNQITLAKPTFVFKPNTSIKQPINLEKKREERQEKKIDFNKSRRQDLINQRRFTS
jgi:hypothetical protein